MSVASALIRTIRPRQWVKNVFVAAPLVFARHLQDPSYVVRAAIATLAFCLVSGAVYTFNDVRDVEADRAHPTKQHRPIAAGQLSERGALIFAGVLAAVSLGACFVLSWKLGLIATVYLVQNVGYSLGLKKVAFLDVMMIAAGFLLRVLAGAAAIDVPASGWVLACTALLATFFGLGKRAHELAWAQRTGQASTTRAALAGYRIDVVRLAMLVFAVATLATYVIYTLDSRTVAAFGTDRLVYSAPFVALGLVRFLYLAIYRPREESPTDAMIKDPWFLLDLAAASATILYVIYGR